MAEERRAGMHSGKALAKMGKEGHARHGVRHEVQKVEAVGVHDVVEEIRERGADPTGEIVDEEMVPSWTGLGAGSGDDARGGMPRRLPSHRGLNFSLWVSTSTIEVKRA